MSHRAPLTVLGIIEPFLELNPRMPLRALQALLQVAAHPGLTVSEHARKSGTSLSSMSRNLLDLSNQHRSVVDGYNFVEARKDVDQREQKYYLTRHGQRVIANALSKLERESR